MYAYAPFGKRKGRREYCLRFGKVDRVAFGPRPKVLTSMGGMKLLSILTSIFAFILAFILALILVSRLNLPWNMDRGIAEVRRIVTNRGDESAMQLKRGLHIMRL